MELKPKQRVLWSLTPAQIYTDELKLLSTKSEIRAFLGTWSDSELHTKEVMVQTVLISGTGFQISSAGTYWEVLGT